MTQQEDIEKFAKELQMLAQEGNYEELAEKLPTAEQLADFMQYMFANSEAFQQFDEQVLQDKR